MKKKKGQTRNHEVKATYKQGIGGGVFIEKVLDLSKTQKWGIQPSCLREQRKRKGDDNGVCGWVGGWISDQRGPLWIRTLVSLLRERQHYCPVLAVMQYDLHLKWIFLKNKKKCFSVLRSDRRRPKMGDQLRGSMINSILY